MILRPYQSDLKNKIYTGWDQGHRNIMAVSPTGSGKTVLFANITREHRGASMLIAHRQELVSQISLALAREEVRHRLIAPEKVIRMIEDTHRQELGENFHNTSAPCMVGGVDTLLARKSKLASVCQQVTLCIQDEGHHVLKKNKWGKASLLFQNARSLLVTATPERADGAGLGSHADGIVDLMVHGPAMRELINDGNLADYRIFAPESDIDITDVEISSKTGDYNQTQLRKAAERSHIVGDIVEQYQKHASGLQGITFVTDVKTAEKVAQRFNDAGIPAAALSAKSDDTYRTNMIDRFRNGQLMQLVNVDLFGEGFDVPAVSVVSFARHTASFGLYVQQFGRALRKFLGKTHGIIIDHVSNVKRHGLPDRPRVWTLDRREKRSRGKKAEDLIPCITCASPVCGQLYEAIHKRCPHCGHYPEPAKNAGPKEVQGDLTEISPEILAALRGEVAKMEMTPSTLHQNLVQSGMPPDWAAGHANRLAKDQHAQGDEKEARGLRGAIAQWGGYARHEGAADSEMYRRFFFKFGIDVMSAKVLKKKEANELKEVINGELTKLGHTVQY